MSNKPSIPKGTRDFSPIEMARRNYIFDTIKKVYKKYGFQQIETPAMENLSTLFGSGGDESDKLIFKILNSGDYLSKADGKALEEKNSTGLTKSIAEKALHYDLTVPFARYVVQNQNEITFPFRRFQIQPVWRADRPQKGRYREFYQCDADIIGSDSLLNEVDLIKIIDDVFTELFQGKLNYTVSINNRKVLAGIAEAIGETDKLIDITVAIDKLDKIGVDKVLEELQFKGVDIKALTKLRPLFELKDDLNENLKFLENLLSTSEIGKKGIEELRTVFNYVNQLGLKTSNLKLDVTLARGLGYYTGTIIEVKVDNFPSITGGGRYDDLTGKFGLKDVSGVGISFGADRIYDVLLDNNLYPEFKGDSTQVLFINFGDKEQDYCLPLLFQLRDAGVNAEIYPEAAKMKKQMTFANNKNIKYVVMVGSDEMEAGKLTVKNMESGEQESLTIEELITLFK
ncbi:histidine--tRNA ligase [Vicingus serpentipes]|uniref:Histidine--tRNA ligase n=1 Tax=Vicingus serpentipes TaxID=1926625 RepID=A0A5C6RSV5_9FLAO|nr:histidine--tRNA ligase [Vicingus serpentipes]TXB65343.1 histidine--tRNA ligase [Vicingus serpentipes]